MSITCPCAAPARHGRIKSLIDVDEREDDCVMIGLQIVCTRSSPNRPRPRHRHLYAPPSGGDVSNVFGIMSDEPSSSEREGGVQLCSSDVFISSVRLSEAAKLCGGIHTERQNCLDEQC